MMFISLQYINIELSHCYNFAYTTNMSLEQLNSKVCYSTAVHAILVWFAFMKMFAQNDGEYFINLKSLLTTYF